MPELPAEATLDTALQVTRAQAGDRRALNALVTSHLPVIYNIIGRGLNGHADVDDVVQETMIRVIRALPTLQDPERFRSWAVTIAYRQLQDHHRRHQKLLSFRGADPADVADPRADFAERTVTELMLRGQRRELAEAARWLEPADRDLFSLWWQEVTGQLTRTELAAVLAVDRQHAAVRLQRMRTQVDVARTVVCALQASPRCERLAVLVQPWNGSPAPLWRKRLNRHIRGCDRCGRHREGLVAPEKLLLGIGMVPVSAVAYASLRAMLEAATPAVASTVTAGGNFVVDQLKNLLSAKSAAAAATAAVVAAGALTYTVFETPAPHASPAPVKATPTVEQHPLAVAPTASASASPGPGPGPGPSPTTLTAPGTVSGVLSADIYVAPSGSDSADGSLARPYATLGKAASVAQPGQTVALRGGTYLPTDPVTITTSGTLDARITLSNYRDERPMIDASRVPVDKWMITHRAGYWTVQGLEIMNSRSHAYVCISCRENVFQRLSIHDNVESALLLRGPGTIGNQVLDSDFFNNHDDATRGAGGLGLGIKFGSGAGNVIHGCRLYHNADDGIDLGEFTSPVTLDSNWAYGNGVNRWNVENWRSNGNGFTLGGGSTPSSVAHVLRNNAAWDNIHHGFTDSANPGRLQFTNNTAYRNGSAGFFLADAAATLRSNIALDNDVAAKLGAAAQATGNTWNGDGWTAAIFRSTDPTTAQGPRSPAGSLPVTDFLSTTDGGMGASMRES